jgi:predicted nucleic acid-binding protein
MSSGARYVLDTNILLSTVLFEHAIPGQALRRALKQEEVLVSPSTLEQLAVSGGATYLISEDDDLRSLNPFRGIAIVTAAEFLTATEEEKDV